MNIHFLLITLLLSGAVMVADNQIPQRERRTLAQRPKCESVSYHQDSPVENFHELETYVYFALVGRFVEEEAEFKKKKLADGMEYVMVAPPETSVKKSLSDVEQAYWWSTFLQKISCTIRLDKIQEKKGFVTGIEYCYVKATLSDSEKFSNDIIYIKNIKSDLAKWSGVYGIEKQDRDHK